MKIQYSMKNMAAWEEHRLVEYIQGKIPSMEKLFSHFQDDEVDLTIRGERFDKNNAYRVELVLEIPSKVIVSTEDSHSIEKAVDLSRDRLVKQLKRHEDQLRSKGKNNSLLKRAIKQLGQLGLGLTRGHQPIAHQTAEEEAMSEESMDPSTLGS